MTVRSFADVLRLLHEHMFGILQSNPSGISTWYAERSSYALESATLGLTPLDRAAVSGFKCATCAKTFSSKFTLERHSLIHLGIRPFVCSVCDKRFNQKSAGFRHVAIRHPNIDPKSNVQTDQTYLRGFAPILGDSDRG